MLSLLGLLVLGAILYYIHTERGGIRNNLPLIVGLVVGYFVLTWLLDSWGSSKLPNLTPVATVTNSSGNKKEVVLLGDKGGMDTATAVLLSLFVLGVGYWLYQKKNDGRMNYTM